MITKEQHLKNDRINTYRNMMRVCRLASSDDSFLATQKTIINYIFTIKTYVK